MRHPSYVRLAIVLALAGLSAPLAAQQSCSGPNGCSLSVGLTATVLSAHVASAARMAVRQDPAQNLVEVVTAANTAWVLSFGGNAGTEVKPVRRSGRGGMAVAQVPAGGSLVVATLAAI
ncbi:MAG: hypothetical protein WBC97_04545 [Gemmatimonadales bacterium]